MQLLFHEVTRVHNEEGMERPLYRTLSPSSLHFEEDHEGLVMSHEDPSPQALQQDTMKQALSKESF